MPRLMSEPVLDLSPTEPAAELAAIREEKASVVRQLESEIAAFVARAESHADEAKRLTQECDEAFRKQVEVATGGGSLRLDVPEDLKSKARVLLCVGVVNAINSERPPGKVRLLRDRLVVAKRELQDADHAVATDEALRRTCDVQDALTACADLLIERSRLVYSLPEDRRSEIPLPIVPDQAVVALQEMSRDIIYRSNDPDLIERHRAQIAAARGGINV